MPVRRAEQIWDTKLGKNMIWVQSKDEFDCVAQFDPATGVLGKHSRAALGVVAPTWPEIAGSFSEVKNGAFVLYRYRGQIFLRAFGNVYELDNQTVVNVCGTGFKRRMSIQTMGCCVLDMEYELVSRNAISCDPTPFVEDEDFDFGLFVSNMSKSRERREVMLGKS